jgi:hypothetical protein
MKSRLLGVEMGGRRAILFLLFFVPVTSIAEAQQLPANLCPPPGQWVSGGGGVMCQCPDGSFYGVGRPCGSYQPQPQQPQQPMGSPQEGYSGGQAGGMFSLTEPGPSGRNYLDNTACAELRPLLNSGGEWGAFANRKWHEIGCDR